MNRLLDPVALTAFGAAGTNTVLAPSTGNFWQDLAWAALSAVLGVVLQFVTTRVIKPTPPPADYGG